MTMSHTILRQKVKIGTKGQAVIPIAMRKAKGIVPGSEVIFEMDSEKNIYVERADHEDDPIAVFKSIAAKVRLKGKVDSNADYNRYMEERSKRKGSK